VKRVFVDRKNELEKRLAGNDGHDQQRQQSGLLQNVRVALAVFSLNRK
jgi:hypothetical protein